MQLRPLKALCSLSLCGIDVDDIEWGRLAPSLTHLALTDAYQLPPGLSQLTRLRSFARESRQDESEFVPAPGWRMGAAEPMLRALTQVRALAAVAWAAGAAFAGALAMAPCPAGLP